MSIENNVDFDHPYSLHKVCGLNENVSIAVIGKLKNEELSFLKGIDFLPSEFRKSIREHCSKPIKLCNILILINA